MDKNIRHMRAILDALPDPAFILSRSGKYVYVFGGSDTRFYHDGSSLVGKRISELLKPDKAQWFLDKIDKALQSPSMTIVEYELSDKDVLGLPSVGPQEPIWFEGRIQPLNFSIDEEPVVLWVASNVSARHQLETTLRHLSDTDQLTGLDNRRKLERDLSHHFASYTRYATPTSVLMLDMDNLKQINDSQGHHVGDETIISVANICRAELRETDIAYRYGGDEFVIVLPSTGHDQAKAFAERLHHRFQQQTAPLTTSGEIATVSVGVTSFMSADQTHEDTLRRADQYLYQAKRNGKNCVIVS